MPLMDIRPLEGDGPVHPRGPGRLTFGLEGGVEDAFSVDHLGNIRGTFLGSTPFGITVRSYLAPEDAGTTDESLLGQALLAAVADTPAGGTVVGSYGDTHLLNEPLPVDKAVTLVGYGAVLTTDDPIVQVEISSSDVTLAGWRITGSQFADYDAAAGGVRAFASSWAAALENVRLVDVTIDNQPFVCFYTKWTKDTVVYGCTFEDYVYGGWIALSNVGGRARATKIRNATQDTAPQAYAFAFTRWSLDTLAVSPKSAAISVIDCDVEDIPWEAIEGHGADDVLVLGNRVRRCLIGVANVPCPDVAGTSDVYSGNGWRVIGNYIDSEVTDGSKESGIKVVGADSAVESDQWAKGCLIEGNTVVRYGKDYAASLQAGISVYNVRDVVISGNAIREPAGAGILLYHDVDGAVIMGNTITDVWSESFVNPAAIASRSANNKWTIAGNRLAAGTKTATYLNVIGQYVASNTGSEWVQGGGNSFSAAATPYSGGSTIARQSFYSTAGVAKPTITGARSGNAGLASLLTQLATAGLVTDSTTAGTTPAAPADVQSFTATGTWTKPAGAVMVDITVIGAGGGGGSGRRGAAGTARTGGGGGAAGGFVRALVPASALGATETVTIRGGGAGGAAVTTDDTDGNAGLAGGVCQVGTILLAHGGLGGAGGKAAVAGTGGAALVASASSGGSSSATGAAGAAAGVGSPQGGCSGGGISTANTPANGASQGFPSTTHTGYATGGVVDGALPQSGVDTTYGPGSRGAGGGAASVTTAAQAGGAGGKYGGGGGGGGASVNGNDSGAGGDGAQGWVQIVTYF